MKEPPSETLSFNNPPPHAEPPWPTLLRLRTEQRQRWQRGERILVESYLEQHPTLVEDAEAVLDLIYTEVMLRSQFAGEKPRLEEYQQRFPHLADQLKDQFDVHSVLESSSKGTLLDEAASSPPPPKFGAESATLADDAAHPGRPRPPSGALWPRVPGYEILGVLGEGAMGVVYKALQVKANRPVALKMIKAGVGASDEQLHRFRQEAEAVARLQHPHIVQIYEVGEAEGRPFFSLEFVEGGSLAQKLAGLPPLPAREAAQLAETLARAMHVVHQLNIVHRDLKPANILMAGGGRKPPGGAASASGGRKPPGDPAAPGGLRPPLAEFTPKITDFGLAKCLDVKEVQTESGVIMGTPGYMSPEQAIGESAEVGPAADVYALGAVLYELLTGRPPFKAATPLETVLLVREEDPLPPRRLQPSVPRDLDSICLKCLEKEPHQRFASALALADDLRRFLDGQPTVTRPRPWWVRVVKWARRRPAQAALVAVSALAALALLVVGLVYNRRLEGALQTTRQREREARRNLYVAHMNLAQRAWQDNHIDRVLALLQEERPRRRDELDPRGFEWHYLNRLCHSARLSVPGTSALALSPDGKLLATVDPKEPRVVTVWDTATGRCRRLKDHRRPVACLAFSPDGRLLASAGSDRRIRLWDAAAGRLTPTRLRAPRPVTCLAFSGKDRLASAGKDRGILIWEVSTGKLLRRIPNAHKPPQGSPEITALAFSPDGRRLASACPNDDVVRTWNPVNGQPRDELPQDATVAVAFSPDGKRLALASTLGPVTVWNVSAEGFQKLYTLTGHAGGVNGVAFGPGSDLLATAGADRTVKLWEVSRLRVRFTWRGHRDEVGGVAFSRDGRQLATLGRRWDRTVKVWDATHDQAFRNLSRHGGQVNGVAFRADGRRLASAGNDGFVKVWDGSTWAEVLSFRAAAGPVNGVSYHPDGKSLATAGADGAVKVWDANSGRPRVTLKGHAGPVLAVAHDPSGRRLASAGADGTVRLWDAETRKELSVLKGHQGEVRSVAFSPDGRLLASGGADETVRVWDTGRGEEVLRLRGQVGTVQGLAFNPAGTLLASSHDQTLILWEVPGGRKVRTLEGHTNRVEGVAFSPDGRRLASASMDHLVKVWDVRSGQETLTLRSNDRGTSSLALCVAFHPNGRLLASGGGYVGHGEVRLWDARPLAESAR
jgi:WD40 repeat protein/serine/threonine protein kinase